MGRILVGRDKTTERLRYEPSKGEIFSSGGGGKDPVKGRATPPADSCFGGGLLERQASTSKTEAEHKKSLEKRRRSCHHPNHTTPTQATYSREDEPRPRERRYRPISVRYHKRSPERTGVNWGPGDLRCSKMAPARKGGHEMIESKYVERKPSGSPKGRDS